MRFPWQKPAPQKQTAPEHLHVIEVTDDWLDLLAKAVIPMPDGSFVRLARLEPLVDKGRERLQFVPADCVWYWPNQVDGNVFSRN